MDALEKFVRDGTLNHILSLDFSLGNSESTIDITSAKKDEKKSDSALELANASKKATKSSQPARGILKKSKEQLRKEKEEALALEEEKRLQREKEKKGISLDSELVAKFMSGEMTVEEQGNSL